MEPSLRDRAGEHPGEASVAATLAQRRQSGSVRPDTRRLRAVLTAVLVQADEPELQLVNQWLDSWRGVGLLAVGLHRVGYDLDLRQYGEGSWRATFLVTG